MNQGRHKHQVQTAARRHEARSKQDPVGKGALESLMEFAKLIGLASRSSGGLNCGTMTVIQCCSPFLGAQNGGVERLTVNVTDLQ